MSLPITKAEAAQIAQTYVTSVGSRVFKFLRDRAAAGLVGGIYSYSPQDSVPELQAVRSRLLADGWTVVVDTGNQTATIS